jgi:hypothetical protein
MDFSTVQFANGQGGSETGQEPPLLGLERLSGIVSIDHTSSYRIGNPDIKKIADNTYPNNTIVRGTVSCDRGDPALGGELKFWNANNSSLFAGPAQMVESAFAPPNSWTISFYLTEKLNEGEQILISATCLDNP